jgi:hypothetical protein
MHESFMLVFKIACEFYHFFTYTRIFMLSGFQDSAAVHIWAESGAFSKFRRAIFSSFYNISQPNFAILLILTCSY